MAIVITKTQSAPTWYKPTTEGKRTPIVVFRRWGESGENLEGYIPSTSTHFSVASASLAASMRSYLTHFGLKQKLADSFALEGGATVAQKVAALMTRLDWLKGEAVPATRKAATPLINRDALAQAIAQAQKIALTKATAFVGGLNEAQCLALWGDKRLTPYLPAQEVDLLAGLEGGEDEVE